MEKYIRKLHSMNKQQKITLNTEHAFSPSSLKFKLRSLLTKLEKKPQTLVNTGEHW